MESGYGCPGVAGCFKHGKGKGAGAVNDAMMWLPRDAVADGFDCGVASGYEDEVGEVGDFGCVVYDSDVGRAFRQPFAMFWSAG